MFDLFFMCERCLSMPVTDKLGHAFPFDLQWITPVHDLNQQCTSSKPDLVIIFFHGIGLGKNYEWKETWTSETSDGECVCWPQKWLPADLASKNVNNVRILSLSYDSALLGANEDVTDIGKNLIQSLVCKRYANLILNILCTNTY
jgi:hypothetical protein